MDLSLDTLKETFFDYNSDCLLDIFYETKERGLINGLMINSKSPDFIHIILNNLLFFYENDDDDDDTLVEL